MDIPFETILWGAIGVCALFPLVIFFFWACSSYVDKKIKKRLLDFYIPKPEKVEVPEFINSNSDLYSCQNMVGRKKCGYNLLPTIAMGKNQCPECGHVYKDITNVDHLMAKSLMLNKRVKTEYMTYLVYEGLIKEGRIAFYYNRSVLAASQEAADRMVNERITEDDRQYLVMRADNFPVSKVGLSFIPPVLIVSNFPAAMGSIDGNNLSYAEANKLAINRIVPKEPVEEVVEEPVEQPVKKKKTTRKKRASKKKPSEDAEN